MGESWVDIQRELSGARGGGGLLNFGYTMKNPQTLTLAQYALLYPSASLDAKTGCCRSPSGRTRPTTLRRTSLSHFLRISVPNVDGSSKVFPGLMYTVLNHPFLLLNPRSLPTMPTGPLTTRPTLVLSTSINSQIHSWAM